MAERKKKGHNVILHDTNTGKEIKEQQLNTQQRDNNFEILKHQAK